MTQAFAGKSVIITGGASGIGRALGACLVASGADVTLADIDGDHVVATAAAIGATGGHALDVRNGAALQSLVDDVATRHGSLDFLFNNAGISLGGATHELSAAHWDRIIDINLRGVVNGVRAAYPRMIDQGHGHIVNTASGAGLAAPPFVTPYATTKYAVVGLSSSLRPEAALHGVRVSVLCPGSIDTPILDRGPDPDLPATASATVTAREYLAALKQKPTAADRFARGALRQVARNRAIIVVPRRAKSLWYLQRTSPALMGVVAGALARKVQRDLIHPRS
jgi:NAD(P)-dependent dehydrogenase (short-subunit alcohol dehydrogenase family)